MSDESMYELAKRLREYADNPSFVSRMVPRGDDDCACRTPPTATNGEDMMDYPPETNAIITTESESDTPLTDALLPVMGDGHRYTADKEMTDFARSLERRLAESQARCKALEAALRELYDSSTALEGTSSGMRDFWTAMDRFTAAQIQARAALSRTNAAAKENK